MLIGTEDIKGRMKTMNKAVYAMKKYKEYEKELQKMKNGAI